VTLSQAETATWWLGIATLLSLVCLAILTSILPRLEEKLEKIAWKMDVGFAWLSVFLFFATFWFSNIVSEKQDVRLEPRQITDSQIEQFKASVASITKGFVETGVDTQDAETMQYADQIRKMLISAGFRPQSGISTLIGSAYPMSGVTIVENLPENNPGASILRDDFKTAGIDSIIYHDPTASVGTLEIVVGGK
jgi:hypothetical protein